MTKADYIQMAIAANTPFDEVIEMAKRMEDYCGPKDDTSAGGAGPVVYGIARMTFRQGDIIRDAHGNHWSLSAA